MERMSSFLGTFLMYLALIGGAFIFYMAYETGTFIGLK